MTTKTLEITEVILSKVKELPIEKQQQILDFVEFISAKNTETKPTENKPKKKRIMGLHKGKGWMSDDFNDPLPPEILGLLFGGGENL